MKTLNVAGAAPIGIFDSGLGGLSVAQEVARLMPSENIFYLADQQYCPYGALPPEVVRQRTLAMHAALTGAAVKLIIAACNTACAVALDDLRQVAKVPVIGLEPAIKPAVKLSRSGRIAVLATPRTVASERLRRLIETWSNGVSVEAIAAPELVEFVESGETSGPAVEAAVELLLRHSIDRGVDVIVLGCTHFPFLREMIEAVAGPGVQVVDSGAAVSRRAREIILAANLVNNDHSQEVVFVAATTGDVVPFEPAVARLIGPALPNHQIRTYATVF